MALPRVYVKVFARHKDGDVKFFKDGYTDLRGMFEYAQTNSTKLHKIEKFAVFVMSDTLGTLFLLSIS